MARSRWPSSGRAPFGGQVRQSVGGLRSLTSGLERRNIALCSHPTVNSQGIRR